MLLETMHSGLEWRDDISATGNHALWTGMEGWSQCYWKPCTLDWNGGMIPVLLETMHSGLEWRDGLSATGNHALWTGMEVGQSMLLETWSRPQASAQPPLRKGSDWARDYER